MLPFISKSRQGKGIHSALCQSRGGLSQGEGWDGDQEGDQKSFRCADVSVSSQVRLHRCVHFGRKSSCTLMICAFFSMNVTPQQMGRRKKKKKTPLSSCKPGQNNPNYVYQGGQVNHSKQFLLYSPPSLQMGTLQKGRCLC